MMDAQIEKEPAFSGEQHADLMQLERMAADGEAAANAPMPGEEPAAPRPALSQEITGLLEVASKMVGPMFPSVAKIYTPEICQAVGVAVAPVCEKHGWLQGGIGGKYGEELMALFIVGPLVWQTAEAVKADIAARKPKKPEIDQSEDKRIDALADQSRRAAFQDDAGKTVRFG
jgi:hypothetical protein